MSPDDDSYYQYWCSPATLHEGSRIWILFRQRVTPVGNTGWTTSPADDKREGPERVAYRPANERRWKKYDIGWIPAENRKEEIPDEEALAIILMTKL